MRSEAQKRADKKYKDKAYEQIKMDVRKDLQLNERIKAAAEKKQVSKTSYMVAAIEKQLADDGFGRADISVED